jgi:hypothetical protein
MPGTHIDPTTNEPRDIGDYVEDRISDFNNEIVTHMDLKFKEVKDLFMSGFPNGDPHLHRQYHQEQIEMLQARSKFWRDMASRLAQGGVLALIGVLASALWYWFQFKIKGVP